MSAIVKKQRCGSGLALVITRARPDWVDVTPVILALRMDTGITVNLGGRGLQDFGAQALRQSQHVDGAVHTGLGRLHRIVLIMNGGGGAGQVVDLIGLEIERKRHIVPDNLKAMMIEHALDVTTCPGEIIIDADDIGALLEQTLAEVRAEKSGPSGNYDTCFEVQLKLLR